MSKKERFKIYFLFPLVILLAMGFVGQVFAATPDKTVRIGLYHNLNKTDFLSINGEKGMDLQSFHSINDSKKISVVKDVYYIKENAKIKIRKIGTAESPNRYIKVGGNVPTYAASLELAKIYKTKGLECFPYYNGSWAVVMGCFDSLEAANSTLAQLKIGFSDVAFEIVPPNMKRLLLLTETLDPMVLYESDKEFVVNPLRDGNLKINEDNRKRYRGAIAFYRTEDGSLKAVNVIDMDKYLYGVVPREIGGASPLEAVKAQAVTARNYTYNNLMKHAKEGFDLCDQDDCQVYGGVYAEHANSNKAVDETRGKILTYGGKPAVVFYFSSTGGIPTEDVKNVWGSNFPYLKSVENKYESGGTYNFVWRVEHSIDKIKEFLNSRKVAIGDISNVEIIKRSPAGRVTELKIIGNSGTKTFEKESARTVFRLSSQYYDISTDADRKVRSGEESSIIRLGGKKVLSKTGKVALSGVAGSVSIKSATGKVKASLKPTKYRFDGKGWGHSVGMSQDGAIGMAKAGFAYSDILTHFFPGTIVQ